MLNSLFGLVLSKTSRRYHQKYTRAKPSSDQFLKHFFETDEYKFIVQIGANDGVQNDPLCNFLKRAGKYQAILIEPIPFYVNKLELLYRDRSDIQIIRAAAGSSSGSSKLYFMPPELADEMNGDGPANNWAHGQGSFDRDTVVHWIRANSFRGKNYRDNIPMYLEAITSIDTPITLTESLLPIERKNLLLVLDVQGFEIEVLRGLDWNRPPKFIMLEDDLGKSADLLEFMRDRDFVWIAGDHDKVFEWMPKARPEL